jgi:hypothetical protein
MRRWMVLLFAATAAVVATAMPAVADQSATSTVTFTLTGGTLDITAPPGPVSIGSAPVGTTTLSGSLGVVSVVDSRGSDPASWVASVASTDFTSGSHTIPAADVSYVAGPLTTTGNPTFASLTVPALSVTPAPVVTASPGSGNNSAAWNPTLTVTIPADAAVAGTYTGTLTHTVV